MSPPFDPEDSASLHIGQAVAGSALEATISNATKTIANIRRTHACIDEFAVFMTFIISILGDFAMGIQ
ncbi:MAG: hypothetical protein MPJ50_18220 [Pirellulales bacterium]|nr:hypothetical protein [Pirellulales bacterium]